MEDRNDFEGDVADLSREFIPHRSPIYTGPRLPRNIGSAGQRLEPNSVQHCARRHHNCAL
jgi:hypothetical protein